jgi:hypothetical protein
MVGITSIVSVIVCCFAELIDDRIVRGHFLASLTEKAEQTTPTELKAPLGKKFTAWQ